MGKKEKKKMKVLTISLVSLSFIKSFAAYNEKLYQF